MSSKREDRQAEKYKAVKDKYQAATKEQNRKVEDPHTEYKGGKWVPKK